MKHPANIVKAPAHCADATRAVLRRISAGNLVRVHVAPNGALYVRSTARDYKTTLPDEWLIGTFGKATPVDEINGSLHERVRELWPEAFAA